MYKRGIVVVVICFFIGASVASSISSDIKQLDIGQKEENINFVGPNSGVKTYKFYPTDDAYISESEPIKNFGNKTYIKIRNAYIPEGSGAYDGLVKFIISSISIPSDEKILSATLHLYYYQEDGYSPSGRDLNLYNVTSDWSEGEVKWEIQPSYDFQSTSYSTVPESTEGWMIWEVTKDVQDSFDFDEPLNNYSWKITDEAPVDPPESPVTSFRSEECGDKIPYLEIKTVKADIYVNINNAEGPRDGTIDHPYQHIQEGIDNASDGNTVFVYNGEYYENILINKSINLIGEHRNTTVIHGVVNIESDGVAIDGFTLEGECIEIHKRNNIAFYNNTFVCGNSYNFNISYCYNVVIRECYISNINESTANIRLDATKYVLIYDNNFLNPKTSGCGIEIYYSEEITILKNYFKDRYQRVVYMESSKFCNIQENQFFSFDKQLSIFSLISLEGCNNNTIMENDLSYMPSIDQNPKNFNINYFIMVKNSNFNWILNNTINGSVSITDNDISFYVPKFIVDNFKYFVTHYLLKKFNVSNRGSLGYGIRLVSSNGNLVKGNNLTNIKVGISIAQSKGNIISRNKIRFCYQFGLHLSTTSNNLIVYNQLYKNYVAIYIEKAYMDYISLNDFIHGGDIAPSPYFQIYSSFLAGSSVIGRFNYWEDPIGFTRVWGIPLIFFFPPLFKSIKEDSVFYQLGVYALNNSAAWWDEVEKGLP